MSPEVLKAKIKHLHEVIDKHPMLTGEQTRQCHGFLDDVAQYSGFEFKSVDRSELRQEITEQEIELLMS